MASRFQKRREARKQRERERAEAEALALGYIEKRGYDKNDPVTVVLPWQDSGCEYRRASFEYLKKKWKDTYPDWDVVIGECFTPEWRKGVAISDGVEKSKDGIVIVADTDGWVENVHEVFESLNRYVVIRPFETVVRLSNIISQKVMSSEIEIPNIDIEVPEYLVEEPYRSQPILGGMVVSYKHVFEKIPLDPRFYDWGMEDTAWTYAIQCLAGTVQFATGNFMHLWHPRLCVRNENNKKLVKAYRYALSNPKDMINLISGGKDWYSLHRDLETVES